MYDPFAEVDDHKRNRLLEYVKKDLDNPLDTSLEGPEWYLVLMTPKHMWPPEDQQYGWLMSSHMEAGFNLLRKRSMQKPTPFTSERIAFIDPIFSTHWCKEYKDFVSAGKKWLFPSGYFDMYNGVNPGSVTNKKWIKDVDTLYIAHNIDNQHWVAVVVDLLKKTVKVYDCILNAFSDTSVYESCKPYTKMIPLLLKQAAPPDERKKMKEQAFTIYRMRNVPQNHQTGDCGVYTLKFIECLALGNVMDGMCDATMPMLRMKLAAEMLDELAEPKIVQMSDPNPRGQSDDRIPLQKDSGQ